MKPTQNKASPCWKTVHLHHAWLGWQWVPIAEIGQKQPPTALAQHLQIRVCVPFATLLHACLNTNENLTPWLHTHYPRTFFFFLQNFVFEAHNCCKHACVPCKWPTLDTTRHFWGWCSGAHPMAHACFTEASFSSSMTYPKMGANGPLVQKWRSYISTHRTPDKFIVEMFKKFAALCAFQNHGIIAAHLACCAQQRWS